MGLSLEEAPGIYYFPPTREAARIRAGLAAPAPSRAPDARPSQAESQETRIRQSAPTPPRWPTAPLVPWVRLLLKDALKRIFRESCFLSFNVTIN